MALSIPVSGTNITQFKEHSGTNSVHSNSNEITREIIHGHGHFTAAFGAWRYIQQISTSQLEASAVARRRRTRRPQGVSADGPLTGLKGIAGEGLKMLKS